MTRRSRGAPMEVCNYPSLHCPWTLLETSNVQPFPYSHRVLSYSLCFRNVSLTITAIVKSASRISSQVDHDMDEASPPINGYLPTGISIRNGPVEEMDVDQPNGVANGKR